MSAGLYALLSFLLGGLGGWTGWRVLRAASYRDAADPPQGPLEWMVPLTAASGAVTAWGLREWPSVVVLTGVAACSVGGMLVATDLDVHRLPRLLTRPCYPVLLLLLTACSAATADWAALYRAAWVAVASWAGYYLLHRVSGRRGLGRGDVTLAGLIGLLLGWFGWQTAAAGVFLAFTLAACSGVALLLTRRVTRSDRIAFGPAMIASTIVLLAFQ